MSVLWVAGRVCLGVWVAVCFVIICLLLSYKCEGEGMNESMNVFLCVCVSFYIYVLRRFLV